MLVPGMVLSRAVSCACISVGKPGYGSVFTSTGFSTSVPFTLIEFESSKISMPISLSLAITGLRWSATALVIVISPCVIAAATIKVPASILSGITQCVQPERLSTPIILMVSVPAPLTHAPISFR